MKSVKKIISAMLSGAMALTICASATLTVSAIEPYQEFESRYEPDQTVAQNSSFSDSELLPYSGLKGGSYSYVAIHMQLVILIAMKIIRIPRITIDLAQVNQTEATAGLQ